MYKKTNKLVAKFLLANMLFSMLATPVMYAQEAVVSDVGTQESIAQVSSDPTSSTEPASDTATTDSTDVKGNDKKEVDSPVIDSGKKSDTAQLNPDDAWKSQIKDPEILKKIKDKEDVLDKELEKYTAKDKDGNEIKLTKEEKRKDKKQAEASLMASRVANDGVTVQPQAYQTVKPSIDQTTGALIYNYPLNLPEGVKGLTPKVSVRYNSQNLKDGSPFGYGWTHSLPYIEDFKQDRYG